MILAKYTDWQLNPVIKVTVNSITFENLLSDIEFSWKDDTDVWIINLNIKAIHSAYKDSFPDVNFNTVESVIIYTQFYQITFGNWNLDIIKMKCDKQITYKSEILAYIFDFKIKIILTKDFNINDIIETI